MVDIVVTIVGAGRKQELWGSAGVVLLKNEFQGAIHLGIELVVLTG